MGERLNEDFYKEKMKVARINMEERIRWRFQHDEVCVERAEYEAEKLRLFLKREEDMKNKKSNDEYQASMRSELRNLREVNRAMTEFQRQRKKDYEKKMRSDLQAEKRFAESTGLGSLGSGGT